MTVPPCMKSPILPWAVVALAVLGSLLFWLFGNPGHEGHVARRWSTLQPTPPEAGYKALLAPQPIGPLPKIADDWTRPHVAVYSVPTIVPPRPLPLLTNLTDNGQAHAIDYLAANSAEKPHAWADLQQALMESITASKDPFRFDRVLVATVARGADWDPGDRMVWTRVFVQPINFDFAGYTVAATENETVKVDSVEATSTRKFTAEIGLTVPGVDGPKASAGPSSEHTVKTTADISAQYERLGIDVMPDFLRIIRESETGGDVLGNTTVSLSIVTDPVTILRRYPNDDHPGTPSEDVVLLVSASTLSRDAVELPPNEATITAAPQVPLPHCPLKARVWMLYERRNIQSGREFYDESRQIVTLNREADPQRDVEMVRADDVSPAVWAVQVRRDTAAEASPVYLGAHVDNGPSRVLVFTDYGQASHMARWARTHPGATVKSGLTLDYDGAGSITPVKLIGDECSDTKVLRGQTRPVYVPGKP